MKSFQSQTYYELLEISVGASISEIHGAYERLSRLYSDEQVVLYGLIEPGLAAALRERLQEALHVLSDDHRRAAYDVEIGLPPREAPPSPLPPPARSLHTLPPPPGAEHLVPGAPPSVSAPSASGPGWPAIAWVSVTPVPAPPPRLINVHELGGSSSLLLGQLHVPAPPSTPVPTATAFGAQPPPPAPLPRESPVASGGSAEASPPEGGSSAAPGAGRDEERRDEVPALVVPGLVVPPLVVPQLVAPPAGAMLPPDASVSPAEPERELEAPVPPAPLPPPLPGVEVPVPEEAHREELGAQASPPAPAMPSTTATASALGSATPRPVEVAVSPPLEAAPRPVPRDVRPEPKVKPFELPPGAEFNGDLLRQVRMARGVSLAQLAEKTRISLRHLENVETDRYDALPASVYLRGILISLARELGLDGSRVVRSYLAFVEAGRSKG